MKKAIVLAAGMGSRLGRASDSIPKPLTEVNGLSILGNALNILVEAGYQEVVLVIGYKGLKIRAFVAALELPVTVRFIENTEWATTNNLYSLYLACDELAGEDGVTLLEGDIFFRASVITALDAQSGRDCLAVVSPLTPLMEGTFAEVDAHGLIRRLGSSKADDHLTADRPLKTANIYYLSADFCKNYLIGELERNVKDNRVNDYYEVTFKTACAQGMGFRVIEVDPGTWIEIDNLYDLRIASYQFSEHKHALLASQHGGYWRFPVTDHALIYNLHFPPAGLKKLMVDRFADIALNYPASAGASLPLLSDFLGVPTENLVIANGVSEIIRLLPRLFSGNVLVFEPSFNEFASAIPAERVTTVRLTAKNQFALDIEHTLRVVEQQRPEAIVLVTPNNPTGGLIPKETILELYARTQDQAPYLIVDESFLDFAGDASDQSVLHDLLAFPRIIVLRSMSKTFGIGGLRLGYAASADQRWLDALRKELPIWNINGFAEEFMLNLPQYRKEYAASCTQVRRETDDLVMQLREIEALEVFATASNFVLCRLRPGYPSAPELAVLLVDDFSIFIKECSGKVMDDADRYLRISSRNREQNDRLIDALKHVLLLDDYTPSVRTGVRPTRTPLSQDAALSE
ncbi:MULTISPECIES: aminotransferase class I/II-fold pyridoxal phosphate-dependent enzyme [unclassified Pseudomonas]|uniref:aminotransferase class I/II-fold pyridoxal phosphate-dependent enzyme n=1 Tax=unclassified Pseudomonas TaxID=196821 RepID=UPI001475D75D|nr:MULTISPECIES: aminotransferase class I/II-fold pyridoxal phosphate-dependent enzyme [unclassified Pseudomonas]NMX94474.1 aminotransferase class I/II-fold pyridoxal phosphate-dependent enzyme [Pseudomonas sp. WS 5086]NMY48805.1 aminotransferase class I/II-fold pyridoxal phosphate-dependent enzyme [Pseudomonas sp. WS 5027]